MVNGRETDTCTHRTLALAGSARGCGVSGWRWSADGEADKRMEVVSGWESGHLHPPQVRCKRMEDIRMMNRHIRLSVFTVDH